MTRRSGRGVAFTSRRSLVRVQHCPPALMSNQFSQGIEVVGSAIIENSQEEILLVKSPKWNNKWLMPGGHIETGEKIEESILREVREETGLTLISKGIINFGELINSKDFHRAAHFIYFDIYCQSEKDIINLDNKELIEFKWLKPQAALKMDLAESYQETIEKFIRYKNS